MITGPIRQDGPIDHIVKTGTPTMGGVIIIIGITLHFSLGRFNKYICMDINICFSHLGSLGLIDDILKIKFKTQAA